jgi:adenylate cyclase
LIDALTGAHIWADRFERDLTHVFALQDEVTVAVVSAIQPKLLQTEIALAMLAESIRLAHRALELDPRFGLVAAVAGLRHMQNLTWGYAIDPQFDREENLGD